jgi:hypothetical protein
MATASASLSRRGATPPRPQSSMHLLLLSPHQARTILDTEVFPGQRPVREHHTAYLAQLMRLHHFVQGTTLTFATMGKQRFLINGVHRLTALGRTREPMWFWVEERRVEDLAAIADLYAVYDKNLPRTWADLYRVDPDLQETMLAPKHLNKLGGALGVLVSGFQRPTGYASDVLLQGLLRNPRVRKALILAWVPEMRQLVTHCQGPGSIRTMLERASVLAVALVTWRFQPAQAEDFWGRLAADSGLVAGQPVHTLLRWLRETPVRSVNSTLYPRYVAEAWNAAVAGRTFPRALAGDPGPLRLAGTPHTGAQHLHYVNVEGEALHEPVSWSESLPGPS